MNHETPSLSYFTIRAGAMSFENKKVREYLLSFIDEDERILNACAGASELPRATIRNDIRDDVDSEYSVDVSELSTVVDEQVDIIVYDPPFSPHQMETYGLERELWPGYGESVFDGFDSMLRDGGKIIQLGFHATVAREGYRTVAIGFFNQLGRMDDWCMTVAKKVKTGGNVRPSSEVPRVREAVVPNRPRERERGSFNVSYRRPAARVRMEDIAETLREKIEQSPAGVGKTLLLHWGSVPSALHSDVETRLGPTEEVVKYEGPADRIVPVSLGAGDSKSGIDLHPEDLHKTVPSLNFDRIILWPHENASKWNIDYRGAAKGYISAFKTEIDQLAGSGSVVNLVGSTATGMRGDWGYSHAGVDVLDGVEDIRCTYVSRFEKGQTGLGERRETNAPVDNGYRDSVEPGEWITRQTRDTWHSHPVMYVSCPECGAHGNTYCVEEGEMAGCIHDERFEMLRAAERRGELRFYRHRRHGAVSTTPDFEQGGQALPSNAESSASESAGGETVATTLQKFVSG